MLEFLRKYKFFLILFIIITFVGITKILISTNPDAQGQLPDNTQQSGSPQANYSGESGNYLNKLELMPVVAEKSKNCVVHIARDTTARNPILGRFSGFNIYKPLKKRALSLGSGVIVSSNGYILTNNHVIESFPGRINVELSGNKFVKAKLIGRDPKADIAVLKIDMTNLPYLEFGDSRILKVGDVVLAVGNPFGIGESVTMGIISALSRSNIGIVDYEDFIQTDAAINPGNSGGALVNLNGELIGINTAIITASGGYEGIGFAIPSNLAKRIYKQIREKGHVERGWIGVAIQDLSSNIMVIDVVSGSPAEKSGLRKNDRLINADEKPIRTKGELRNIIANTEIGSEINFLISRHGKELNIKVKVSKLPENTNFFDVKLFSFPAK